LFDPQRKIARRAGSAPLSKSTPHIDKDVPLLNLGCMTSGWSARIGVHSRSMADNKKALLVFGIIEIKNVEHPTLNVQCRIKLSSPAVPGRKIPCE
jgi:hypothetical protein